MGSILGGGSKKAKPAQPYAGAQFQPYTYTSTIGTTTGKPSGLAFNVGSNIDPQLTALQQTALGATQPFLQGYLGQAQEAIPMFSGVDDGEQRARDIFRTQSALLQPEFEQQRQQLQSDLFGRGRLGLQLAGETAGAGTGMVQPDAYGLGLAQSRALAELSSSARTQAQGEQAQAFEQALGGYTTNLASRQQQLSNLLGGLQTGLGTAGTVTEFEQNLVNQGLSIEQARSAAQASSAQGGAALAQAGRKESGGGMFGDLLSGAAQAAAAYYGAKTSDKRLKTNIRKVGELASGLNTYFWDWTEEAKKFVGNQVTFGVMAQEAMEIFPEAVSTSPSGYLQVDYSRIR
jgi:hypothetical protein